MAPSELLRGIERRRVTVIDLTPAYWHQVLALTEPGDERLRSRPADDHRRRDGGPGRLPGRAAGGPWARLLNAYGLTETTITSALFDVGALAGTGTEPQVRRAGRAVRRARRPDHGP